jgi:NAD(P)-dependent dehydrogenase (short-subunit alcohol dehydrogenase family)
VLVNNAGYGLLGASEELTEEALRDAFETNCSGRRASPRAVLPAMRAQCAGHIVQMSSGPGGSAYAGPFRTDFSGRSLRFATPMDAYAPLIGPASAAFSASHGIQPNDPYRGAQAIIAAVEVEHPPLRLLLGTEALGWLRAYLTGRVDALAAAEVLGDDAAYAAG